MGGLLAAVAIVALGACSSSGSSSSSGGGGGGGGGNTNDFCNAIKVDQAGFDKLGTDPTNAQLQGLLNDLTNKAPAEIKADMAALVKGVKDSQSALSELSADPSKAASIESQFSGEEAALQTSATHIETFVKDKCGIDLTSSDSSST